MLPSLGYIVSIPCSSCKILKIRGGDADEIRNEFNNPRWRIDVIWQLPQAGAVSLQRPTLVRITEKKQSETELSLPNIKFKGSSIFAVVCIFSWTTSVALERQSSATLIKVL